MDEATTSLTFIILQKTTMRSTILGLLLAADTVSSFTLSGMAAPRLAPCKAADSGEAAAMDLDLDDMVS